MRILPVLQSNICKQSFRAGNTSLYSDFDGTFFPFIEDTFRQKENAFELGMMNRMYSGIRSFTQIAKGKFDFTITTGRNKKEMEFVLNAMKDSGVDFCEPQAYILRDGLAQFQNSGKRNNLVLNSTSVAEVQSEEELRKTAEKIIKSIGEPISVIQSVVNKGKRDFGEESVEYFFEKLPVSKRKRYASIVADSTGLIEIAFSPNVDTKKYVQKFKEYFAQKGLKYDVISFNSPFDFYIPYQTTNNPKDYDFKTANVIIIKPLRNNKRPDKIDQPKEQLRQIVEGKTGDLVIVAGDACNDKTMLNPLEYLDVYGLNVDTSKPIEEILSNQEVVNALRKLPLVSIVAGDRQDIQDILELKRALDKMRIYKIMHAQNSREDMLSSIKRGMVAYSDVDSKYKYSLGYDLYSEILE